MVQDELKLVNVTRNKAKAIVEDFQTNCVSVDALLVQIISEHKIQLVEQNELLSRRNKFFARIESLEKKSCNIVEFCIWYSALIYIAIVDYSQQMLGL